MTAWGSHPSVADKALLLQVSRPHFAEFKRSFSVLLINFMLLFSKKYSFTHEYSDYSNMIYFS